MKLPCIQSAWDEFVNHLFRWLYHVFRARFAIFLYVESFAEDAEDSCKIYCEEAIKQDPENPDAYQVMANLLLSEQDNEVCLIIFCDIR